MIDINYFLKESSKGGISVDQQVEFLNFTEDRGLDPEELEFCIRFLYDHMPETLDLPGAIDICGTGGSMLQRINTSTISAFVLAALDVKISKHGNRASSGRFGSFDLLEKMGINIELGKNKLENIFAKTNLSFIYARMFHPIIKHFTEARKTFGKPTFFNLIGPLLSPSKVKRQIIGTTFKDKMKLIAETCRGLLKEQVFVVCGDDGLDEVTLCGNTNVVELKGGEIQEYVLAPEDFGISGCSFSEIEGGDAETNEQIAFDILKGKCESRHADLVFINCALALKLYGKVEDLKEGYEIAKDVCGKGKAYEKFLEYKDLSNSL